MLYKILLFALYTVGSVGLTLMVVAAFLGLKRPAQRDE